MSLRKTLYAGAFVGSMFAFGSQAHAACGEVSITEMDWDSARVVTAVSKFILEQGYGCKLTIVPSASTPALASVAETGEPDILTEIWTNAAPAYEPLIKDKKIEELTEVLSDGGVEGWWIPNYLLEKHPELATIDGIVKNPELVGGRFHNCPVGWTCQVVNTNMALGAKLKENGIEDFIHGSGETLAASIGSAFTAKEPWFGYYWAPTSILGKYPMTLVDMGEHNAEGHACNSKEGCATPFVGAYPKSIVTTVVSTSFGEANPEIKELMTKVSFTNEQMGSVLAWKEDNKASADEAAAHFLTTYSDVWKNWLNDEASKKLGALFNL